MAAGLVSKDLGTDVLEDLFASAEYRRAMAAVYVKRALAAALERAT
jgi:CO/xanthine dehydrogenase FAD-binding subunit